MKENVLKFMSFFPFLVFSFCNIFFHISNSFGRAQCTFNKFRNRIECCWNFNDKFFILRNWNVCVGVGVYQMQDGMQVVSCIQIQGMESFKQILLIHNRKSNSSRAPAINRRTIPNSNSLKLKIKFFLLK